MSEEYFDIVYPVSWALLEEFQQASPCARLWLELLLLRRGHHRSRGIPILLFVDNLPSLEAVNAPEDRTIMSKVPEIIPLVVPSYTKTLADGLREHNYPHKP